MSQSGTTSAVVWCAFAATRSLYSWARELKESALSATAVRARRRRPSPVRLSLNNSRPPGKAASARCRKAVPLSPTAKASSVHSRSRTSPRVVRKSSSLPHHETQRKASTMDGVSQLFDNNRRWVGHMISGDPDFFRKLAGQQTPKFLWIGCADSRVPANEIVGLRPGELFVHRNVSNVVAANDPNCLS